LPLLKINSAEVMQHDRQKVRCVDRAIGCSVTGLVATDMQGISAKVLTLVEHPFVPYAQAWSSRLYSSLLLIPTFILYRL
jgi:hypothetical protein